MEFRQLRSFVEVVRQGSFTQAAQVRHASQSTISKQVAQLEQSLGVQVLERNGPHVRLTDAGAVVFRRAEEMLRLRRDLLSELDDLSQLNRGELRLGLPLLGADALFAQRFAEYRRRYPNIAVHLVEGGSKTMEQAVLAGELELAGSLTPADDGFDYQPFCNEPLDVLLPAGHPRPLPPASPSANWRTARSCSTSRASPSTTACCAPAWRPASARAKAAAAARPTSSARWWRPTREWCCYHGRSLARSNAREWCGSCSGSRTCAGTSPSSGAVAATCRGRRRPGWSCCASSRWRKARRKMNNRQLGRS